MIVRSLRGPSLALACVLAFSTASHAGIIGTKDEKQQHVTSGKVIPPSKRSKLPKATNCAKPAEKVALDVRALQTEMMLAALTCNERSRYNTFVTKFKGELGVQSRVMTGYFNRVYKGQGSSQMNRFVTRLANDASSNSWSRSGTPFCNAARENITKVLAASPSELEEIATENPRYETLHGITPCEDVKVISKKKSEITPEPTKKKTVKKTSKKTEKKAEAPAKKDAAPAPAKAKQ